MLLSIKFLSYKNHKPKGWYKMKKFVLTMMTVVCLTTILSAVTLGVYVKNETVNLGNMKIRAAMVVQVNDDSLASNFIRPGDMIISVCHSQQAEFHASSLGNTLHIKSVPEPSGNKGELNHIDSNYIGISQLLNVVNRYGVVDIDRLIERLSYISEGEAFGLIVLRNGRFIEYTLY